MPYLIESDTNLPRIVAQGQDKEGNDYRETESVVYARGEVVFEDQVTPEMREKIESGDRPHLSNLVKVIGEDEAREILAERGQDYPVAPEHEAEAQVLAEDGRDVLTHDEVVAANLYGDAPAETVVEPDLTEGREPEDPDSVRVTENDDKRRGDGEAPEPLPPASERSSSDSRDDGPSLKELKERAKELGIPVSNKNKQQLSDEIAEAEAASGNDDGDSQS